MLRVFSAFLVICVIASSSAAFGQNWSLVIRDISANTPTNQVNGTSGATATLFGTIFNNTGTPFSDDGTGMAAPATLLDFAGFGFTLNPGQYDIGSLFVPDARIPGWPNVDGSMDGSTPGTSGYVSFGSFDLSGLAPGTYEEDFEAGAYPDDINSTIPFDPIHGTLQINVQPAGTPTPEANTLVDLCVGASLSATFWFRKPTEDC